MLTPSARDSTIRILLPANCCRSWFSLSCIEQGIENFLPEMVTPYIYMSPHHRFSGGEGMLFYPNRSLGYDVCTPKWCVFLHFRCRFCKKKWFSRTWILSLFPLEIRALRDFSYHENSMILTLLSPRSESFCFWKKRLWKWL